MSDKQLNKWFDHVAQISQSPEQLGEFRYPNIAQEPLMHSGNPVPSKKAPAYYASSPLPILQLQTLENLTPIYCPVNKMIPYIMLFPSLSTPSIFILQQRSVFFFRSSSFSLQQILYLSLLGRMIIMLQWQTKLLSIFYLTYNLRVEGTLIWSLTYIYKAWFMVLSLWQSPIPDSLQTSLQMSGHTHAVPPITTNSMMMSMLPRLFLSPLWHSFLPSLLTMHVVLSSPILPYLPSTLFPSLATLSDGVPLSGVLGALSDFDLPPLVNFRLQSVTISSNSSRTIKAMVVLLVGIRYQLQQKVGQKDIFSSISNNQASSSLISSISDSTSCCMTCVSQYSLSQLVMSFSDISLSMMEFMRMSRLNPLDSATCSIFLRINDIYSSNIPFYAILDMRLL